MADGSHGIVEVLTHKFFLKFRRRQFPSEEPPVVQVVSISDYIATLFRSMGGKYQPGTVHPVVFQVVECRQSVPFIEMVDIRPPQGLNNLGAPNTQNDILRDPRLLI